MLVAFAIPASSISAQAERGKAVSACDNHFSPKAITVSKGTRVTRVIRQGAHNVKGRGFAPPVLARRRTCSKESKMGGTYRFVCSLHSRMAGKVTVR